MVLRSLLIVSSVVFLANCSTWEKPVERQVSAVGGQCAFRSDMPPLFNVLENTREKIVVELGDFAQKFNLSSGFKYKIVHRGSREDRPAINTKWVALETQVKEGSSNARSTVVEVPVTKTGVYIFKVYENEKKPVWIQKVFGIAKGDSTLSPTEKENLAKQYAPVVSMHDEEEFFPVSLEYLTNQVEVDPRLEKESYRLTNRKGLLSSSHEMTYDFPFADLLKVLPYYGHAGSVLKPSSESVSMKTRYGKNHHMVYYSVFENPKQKEIYINYHFFYTFDPKTGTKDKEALPSHIFDRESMTVVLKRSADINKGIYPLMVFYGAHLDTQLMAELNEEGDYKQRWYTGRVYVNWPLVIKNGGRPVPAIAKGSHGVFPRKGTYAVYLNEGKIKMLTEPAGGNRLLYPEFVNKDDPSLKLTPTSYSYALRSLDLDNVTSNCSAKGLLAFSGSTVDILGPANATFPPFTDREEDYNSYADPNSPMFDMSK